jgi:hypothetical protein
VFFAEAECQGGGASTTQSNGGSSSVAFVSGTQTTPLNGGYIAKTEFDTSTTHTMQANTGLPGYTSSGRFGGMRQNRLTSRNTEDWLAYRFAGTVTPGTGVAVTVGAGGAGGGAGGSGYVIIHYEV